MESPTSNSNINVVKETRKVLNELRSNLSREETKRIRKKLYKKETASYFFKEKELEVSLTNRQKNVLKNIDRYLKNIGKRLKNLKKHFKKSKKYRYDTDYFINEEDSTTNNDINAFQEARMLLNERRSNLFCKETNEIRKKLYKKEVVYNFLKEKEQNDSLTNSEKKALKKSILKILKSIWKNYKNIDTILYMA